MIGIIVVTHSSLAAEFVKAAEMIVGPAELLQSVSIDRSIDPEKVQKQLRGSVVEMGRDGDGIIILTDMFGGTPTNVCAELLAESKVEIVTGVNLPMLLKCISARNELPVSELAAFLKDYARKAVLNLTEML